MSNLSMGISPGLRDTRVIAMTGSRETILKARLSRQPSHPRALATLLEALALWQGLQVPALRFVRPRGMGCPTRAFIARRSPTSAARCTPSNGSPPPPSAPAAATSAASVTSPIYVGS